MEFVLNVKIDLAKLATDSILLFAPVA